MNPSVSRNGHTHARNLSFRPLSGKHRTGPPSPSAGRSLCSRRVPCLPRSTSLPLFLWQSRGSASVFAPIVPSLPTCYAHFAANNYKISERQWLAGATTSSQSQITLQRHTRFRNISHVSINSQDEDGAPPRSANFCGGFFQSIPLHDARPRGTRKHPYSGKIVAHNRWQAVTSGLGTHCRHLLRLPLSLNAFLPFSCTIGCASNRQISAPRSSTPACNAETRILATNCRG